MRKRSQRKSKKEKSFLKLNVSKDGLVLGAPGFHPSPENFVPLKKMPKGFASSPRGNAPNACFVPVKVAKDGLVLGAPGFHPAPESFAPVKKRKTKKTSKK